MSFEPTAIQQDAHCDTCSRPHTFNKECPTDLSPLKPGWDEYWLEIAVAVSKRADCRRRKASCILVKDNRLVSTGYNASPAGQPGCLAGFCPRGLLSYDELQAHSSYDSGPGKCHSIHAEANAIIYARGDDVRGGTAYMYPGSACPGCEKLLRGAGIARVVWIDPDDVVSEMRLDGGIPLAS